jgi:hypothetical protein
VPSIPARVAALLAKEKSRRATNDTVDDVFARLHADHVPAYEAMIVVERLFGIHFNESKRAAAASSSYGPAFARSHGVQNAAEAALDQLAEE